LTRPPNSAIDDVTRLSSQNLDDVYAVYTGTLGSVFSAMTAWVAALGIAFLVMSARRARPLWRQFQASQEGATAEGVGGA
jgi:hypothetical protein